MPNRTQVVSVTRAVMAAETASHGGLSKAVAALTLKTGSVDAAKSAKTAALKAAQDAGMEPNVDCARMQGCYEIAVHATLKVRFSTCGLYWKKVWRPLLHVTQTAVFSL